ncbi:AF4/FMR2 family member 1-like [Melanerpes formicivorus]|uniref:AF4/FMR2 family member 1-like n=1 Tax=Melanerpes formicivorus TaxID=211600 RepID=UPI00358EFD1F
MGVVTLVGYLGVLGDPGRAALLLRSWVVIGGGAELIGKCVETTGKRPGSPGLSLAFCDSISMIGKEVHLSDSEESSEDQPDEVVEKPPTLLAAPSHSMIGKEVHLSDSEESSEDQVPVAAVENLLEFSAVAIEPSNWMSINVHLVIVGVFLMDQDVMKGKVNVDWLRWSSRLTIDGRGCMIVKEVHLSDSEESSEDQPDEVVEKPPTLLAAPSHSVPQLPGEGSQQDIGEVKRNPSAQNELCNMTSRNTSAKPLELLKRIIEAARKRKKSEKEKKSSVGAAPSISQEQKMLEEDLHPRDSEDGHDDQVVEKPPCSLAGPWHSGPQLLEEGNQQEMGEVKLHPCAQNSPWKVTRKIGRGKPFQLMKRIMEAERMAEKVEKVKMSLVGAAPSTSQKREWSEKEEISVGCAATNLSSERNGPQVPAKSSQQEMGEAKQHPSAQRQPLKVTPKNPSGKPLEKRKREKEGEAARKKLKSEKEALSVGCAATNISSERNGPQVPAESNQQEMGEAKQHPSAQRQPLKVTPKNPSGKPLEKRKREKEGEAARKKLKSEKEALSVGCAATNISSERNGPQVPAKSSQQEMGEAKQHPSAQRQPSTVTPNIHSGKPLEKRKGSTGYVTKPFPVPECSSRLSRPHLKAAKKQQVKYYQEEVKRLKGKADAMPHFIGKGIQYLDAALCFAEYGMGLEWDAPPPRSASHIFRETIELIRLITTMKSFVDSSPTPHEEILLLLCMRCQSLLHMAMLQHKRDTAMKYCGILSHHFESSSRATRAPSASAASSSATSIESAVSVPTQVPLITSSYVEVTSSIFPACDTWDEAEALARKNKELFAELSAAAGSLALNSSVRELVRYAKRALQWLRRETNTP